MSRVNSVSLTIQRRVPADRTSQDALRVANIVEIRVGRRILVLRAHGEVTNARGCRRASQIDVAYMSKRLSRQAPAASTRPEVVAFETVPGSLPSVPVGGGAFVSSVPFARRLAHPCSVSCFRDKKIKAHVGGKGSGCSRGEDFGETSIVIFYT
jgi:hypothetical protein